MFSSVEDANDALSITMPVERGFLVLAHVIMTVPGLGRTFAIG